MIIYIIIHLIGAILGYFLRREQLKNFGFVYTTSDRVINITTHLLTGWIAVFATIVMYFVEKESDKPAKW